MSLKKTAKHEEDENHRKHDEMPGGNNPEPQHDERNRDQRERKVDQRKENLLHRKDEAIDLDLLEKRSRVDDRPKSSVCRVAHKGERNVTDDEVQGEILYRPAKHVRENNAHDNHHEQRVENAPDNAQDAASIFKLKILAYKLLENKDVFGKRARCVALSELGLC